MALNIDMGVVLLVSVAWLVSSLLAGIVWSRVSRALQMPRRRARMR